MSITITRRPKRMGGANVHSGCPYTGELLTTQGGTMMYSAYSGGLLNLNSGGSWKPVSVAADHAVLYSGAGRLQFAFPHQAISGVSIIFYDAATAARSGPNTNQESGRPTLGVLPAVTFTGPINGITSGTQSLGGPTGPIPFNVPFYSGLAVSAPSGTPGFTVTWSPEVAPTYAD